MLRVSHKTSDLDIFKKMQDSSNFPVPAMAPNFQTLTKTTASKLRRAAAWVENSIAQMPEPATKGTDVNEKKTRGDEIRLLAFFPQSKPFWDDCAHKLECFACDFSNKSYDETVNRTN